MLSDTTEAVADFDMGVDANTKWGDVFDALTTSEQECIGNAFDGAVLEAVLDRPVMSASDTTDAWEILIFSCLAPQTARAVFLSTTIAEMEEDVVLAIYADSLACLDEWVAGLDVVATLVALSVDDGEAIGGIVTPFMTCTSDLVISAMLEEAGMALEDLSEEEASCLRTWVAETDWPTLLAGSTDDRSVLFGFIPDLIPCVPNLLLSSFLEEAGMTLEDLSEEEASCLRTWVAETDWPTLLAGSADDLSLLVGILPGLSACVPDLFLSSFLEETGMTLEDLSEEEASCLRTWVAETDWPTLLAGSADDLSLLVDIYPDLSYCVPDLWWPEPSDRWDELIQEATPVEIGEPSQGELDYEGDRDYFAFEAQEGEFYQLDVTLGSLPDSVLDLFDADGTWLAGNDDYDDSLASRLIWHAPATGTYYIQVTDFFAGTGTYTLTIGDSSTFIPPDEGDFTAVTVGWDHSCGIRRDRTVSCWGDNAKGQAVPPDGEFVALAAGRSHTCGIDARQEVVCWGWDALGATEAPEGRFIAVTAGGDHSCAIRTDRSVGCWGADHSGQADPPLGEFAAVAAGEWHTCGLRNTDQTVACWGSDNEGQADPPPGRFVSLAAGNWHSCGVRADSVGVCWGADHAGRANPPAEPFRAIAAGWQHSCGITVDNSVVCWGYDEHGQASPPPGEFSAIALGDRHSCGLHTGGAITCWGKLAGQDGRTPSTALVPTPSDVYQPAMLVVGAVPPTVADSTEVTRPGVVVTKMTGGGGSWGSVHLGSIPAGTVIRVTYDSMLAQPWDHGEGTSYLWVSEEWDYGWFGREWITHEDLDALNLTCHVFSAYRESVASYDPDEDSWEHEPADSYSTHSGCADYRSYELTPYSNEHGEGWYGFRGEYTFEVRDYRGWSPDSMSLSFEHMYWTFEIVSLPDVTLPTAPRYEGVYGMP